MPKRYRESNGFTFLDPYSSYTNNSNPSLNNTIETPYPYTVGTKKSISDVVTPNFLKRQAAGEIIINPLDIREETIDITLGTMAYKLQWNYPASPAKWNTYTTTQYAYRDSDMVFPSAPRGLVNTTDLITIAGTGAAAKVEAPEFAGLTAVAELAETIGYLTNPLKSSLKLLKSAKTSYIEALRKEKPGVKELRDLSEYIASEWLSYRYAFTPIMSDVQSLMEAGEAKAYHRGEKLGFSSSGRKRRIALKRATAFAEAADTTYDDSGTYTANSNVYGYSVTVQEQVRVTSGILYIVALDPNTFGFRSSDVPKAAWEAIPFSFMADWVTNIGDWVQAVTPKVGITQLGSWTTIRTERDEQARKWLVSMPNHSSGAPRIILSNALSQRDHNEKTVSRRRGHTVGLTSRASPFRDDKGIKRTADLVALAHNLLRFSATSNKARRNGYR